MKRIFHRTQDDLVKIYYNAILAAESPAKALDLSGLVRYLHSFLIVFATEVFRYGSSHAHVVGVVNSCTLPP